VEIVNWKSTLQRRGSQIVRKSEKDYPSECYSPFPKEHDVREKNRSRERLSPEWVETGKVYETETRESGRSGGGYKVEYGGGGKFLRSVRGGKNGGRRTNYGDRIPA